MNTPAMDPSANPAQREASLEEIALKGAVEIAAIIADRDDLRNKCAGLEQQIVDLQAAHDRETIASMARLDEQRMLIAKYITDRDTLVGYIETVHLQREIEKNGVLKLNARGDKINAAIGERTLETKSLDAKSAAEMAQRYKPDIRQGSHRAGNSGAPLNVTPRPQPMPEMPERIAV